MESKTLVVSLPQNTARECDDSRHGCGSASKRRTSPESLSSSLSPSSDLEGNNYEVFLSFRGLDTRKGFTDLLYQNLTDVGIQVFRDNNELPVGKPIKPALIEAINQSRILVPIISRDYASSKSCLMELVHILKCRQTMNRKVIPIFYEINPSDLKVPDLEVSSCLNSKVPDQKVPLDLEVPDWKVQSNSFLESSHEHKKNSFVESLLEHMKNNVDGETIKEWKMALKEIGSSKGFETANMHNGHHSKVIEELISFFQKELKKGRLHVTEDLVGVDHHEQEIMKKLGVVHHKGKGIGICASDVRVLGIYGIAGVGKTTIAKVVYNHLYDCFQGCSHLNIAELRQGDMTLTLQNKLISDLRKRPATFTRHEDAKTALALSFRDKRVLILLDNVDDVKQLNLVLKERAWYGLGSRIIVTSRKSDILLQFKPAETYEVEAMEEEKALILFSKHAFQRDSPDEGFENLSRKIIKAIGRLPLALEVVGSRLCGKPKDIWQEMSKKLEQDPPKDVESVLEDGYNDLDENTQQIFLDIACFLIGKDRRIAFHMWDDCKRYPHIGIDALSALSWVKIGENKELLMHDLLRTLGRNIVSKEDRIPHNRSRLWMHDQALSTLRRKKGTPQVQALGLTFDQEPHDCFTSEEFGPLSELRFLNLDQANMTGDFTNLLFELRWLHWRGYRKSSEPLNLCLENLVILDLSLSAVADDWEGWTQIMKKAKKLKVLDLTGCSELHETPCFPADSKLEILNLEGCSHLSVIDKSIGKLKNLKSLNIKSTGILLLPEEMTNLVNLEELLIDKTSIHDLLFLSGSMQKLKTISASSCENLNKISEDIGCLRSLSYLALDESNIKGLPLDVKMLEGLVELSLRNCQRITALPASIGMLKSLQKMDLSNTSIEVLPKSIRKLDRLEVLRMNGTHISTFPEDIAYLGKLQVITFSDCPTMKGEILCDISKLSSLRILELSFTLISRLPESICQLSHLQYLHLLGCDKLWNLPTLPSSLVSLRWGTKNMGEVQDFSYLRNLKVLELVNDPDEDKPSSEPSQMKTFGWILKLPNLENLKLCLPNVTSLPEDFHAFTQLKKLNLSCTNLQDLPKLPSNLSKLLIKNCKSQRVDFSNLETLSKLKLCDCDASEALGLGNLRLLQVLKISHCKIKNLDGLEQASQLRKFSMSQCYSLDRLPDVSKCKNLEFKEIVFCNIEDQPFTKKKKH